MANKEDVVVVRQRDDAFSLELIRTCGLIIALIILLILVLTTFIWIYRAGNKFKTKYFNVECLISDYDKYTWYSKRKSLKANLTFQSILGCTYLTLYLIIRTMKDIKRLRILEPLFMFILYTTLLLWIMWCNIVSKLYSWYANVDQNNCPSFKKTIYSDRLALQRTCLFLLILGVISVIAFIITYFVISTMKNQRGILNSHSNGMEYERIANTSDYSTETDS